MTSVVGWTGSRSRPSTSGFSKSAVWPRTVAIRLFGVRRLHLRRVGRLRLALDRVATELVAQRGVDLRRERVLAARREALVERRRDDRCRDALVDRILDRPAALAGVLDVGLERLEVIALELERARGELVEPRAHD